MFCELCGAPARDSSNGVYTCVDCVTVVDAVPRYDPLTGYHKTAAPAWYTMDDMLAGYGSEHI